MILQNDVYGIRISFNSLLTKNWNQISLHLGIYKQALVETINC